MVGHKRKNDKGEIITHFDLLKDADVMRWVENLKARSSLTAGTYLRGLGFYCERMKTDPQKVLSDARQIKLLQDQFMDFVRGMEHEGKAGSYISRYKKVIHSWVRFNNIEFKSNAYIRNENFNERTQSETIPTSEELAKIIRHAGLREKVAISLMAFSGMRPRSISNDSGSDCLKLKDLPDLKIDGTQMTFDKIPVRILVRSVLNKGQKHGYFTFLSNEGVTYLREYLEHRLQEAETLTPNSPLLQYDRNVKRKHEYIPTFFIERYIRNTFRESGIDKRPYILRAYFATAMDIAEAKGKISHPWRQFFMGHVGDIEARYSTNKKLPDDVIEEMRTAYQNASEYFETIPRIKGPSDDYIRLTREPSVLALNKIYNIGLSEAQINDILLLEQDEFQAWINGVLEKEPTGKNANGPKHIEVDAERLTTYLDQGYELVSFYPRGDRAIVRQLG